VIQHKQLIDEYKANGFVVVEGVFTVAEVEAIAELAIKHVDMIIKPREAGAPPEARKVGQPFLKDAKFREFVLDARLTSLVSELLGGKKALLATDQIFMKPPRHGSAKPYHQDNAYFCATPIDDVITAWIALDDVDEENGCLRYIRGSHLHPVVPHTPIAGEEYNMTPDKSQIDLSKEVLACVKKGGVVFHHSHALHTSHRNDSDRWRRGYASHWVSPDVTAGDKSVQNGYFTRADYPK
jgi:phytanoyl-CoA hydroxylase